MRVLIVDDDPAIRKAYARVLGSLECEVDLAESAENALRILEANADIDVVLADLVMPEGDGLSLMREVRSLAPDLPIIVVTGHPSVTSAAASVEQGAFRYLTKPIDPEGLKAVVKTATEVHRLARLRRRAINFVESEGVIAVERATLDERFTAALENLWMAYQPIVSPHDRTVFAHEALVRSREATLPHPGALFTAAERLGRVHELGRRIRAAVATAVAGTAEGPLFFVNLHAADLNDPSLYAKGSPLTKIAHRVVLEITERRSLEQVAEVAGRMQNLRALGFRIAIDDLGAGYAGLSSFGQLEPEVVKLDMSLVRGIDASSRRQSLVESMISLCHKDLDIQVICEGVETTGERDTLSKLGCKLMQGYLFARPSRELATVSWGDQAIGA